MKRIYIVFLAASAFCQQPVSVKDPASSNVAAVTANKGLTVAGVGNAAVVSGQQSVTASAVALGTNSVKQVCINALSGNAISVFIGPSGVTISTGLELAAKSGVCLPVTNTNLLYVIASTTGASVTWIATN